MIIHAQTNNAAQFGLWATLSDYDGTPPAEALLLDHKPTHSNPDRVAVAAYLAFGRWCGGELTLPSKISPATASAIAFDAHPLHTLCQPIEYYPKALPIGQHRITLSLGLPIDDERPTICDLPAHRWNGSLRSLSSVAVGSNSFLFRQSENDVRPILAVGLLFAEDVSADVLILETAVEPSELTRLRALLSAVRLGLEVQS